MSGFLKYSWPTHSSIHLNVNNSLLSLSYSNLSLYFKNLSLSLHPTPHPIPLITFLVSYYTLQQPLFPPYRFTLSHTTPRYLSHSSPIFFPSSHHAIPLVSLQIASPPTLSYLIPLFYTQPLRVLHPILPLLPYRSTPNHTPPLSTRCTQSRFPLCLAAVGEINEAEVVVYSRAVVFCCGWTEGLPIPPLHTCCTADVFSYAEGLLLLFLAQFDPLRLH